MTSESRRWPSGNSSRCTTFAVADSVHSNSLHGGIWKVLTKFGKSKMSSIAPSQIAFHAAHKARLARIAAAAKLHHERKLQAHARELTVRCERTRRRPYEVAGRAMEWMPLTRRILKAIASEYGLTIEDLTGQSRKGRVMHARHVAVGLIFEMTKLSYPAIGRRVGNRDHTTIINSVRQARKLFASEAFRNRIDQIKQEVT